MRLVGRDIADGRLVNLVPDYECTATEFDTGAWALYPSRSFLPRKVRAMIGFLREVLATEDFETKSQVSQLDGGA